MYIGSSYISIYTYIYRIQDISMFIHTSKVKTVSTPMHYVLGVDNEI